jgi:hypothetical protein
MFVKEEKRGHGSLCLAVFANLLRINHTEMLREEYHEENINADPGHSHICNPWVDTCDYPNTKDATSM